MNLSRIKSLHHHLIHQDLTLWIWVGLQIQGLVQIAEITIQTTFGIVDGNSIVQKLSRVIKGMGHCPIPFFFNHKE